MTDDIKMLARFHKMTETLNETRGTNDKLRVLEQYRDLEPVIKRVWDPNTVTNVTRKNLEKREREALVDAKNADDFTFTELFDRLTGRVLTGHAAQAACWRYISRAGNEYRDMLLGMLEKKPRVRLGKKMIQRVFPDAFTIFAVALAEEYDEQTFARVYERAGRTAWMSKKIDGIRLIAEIQSSKDDIAITFSSRTGKRFNIPVLERDLRDNLCAYLRPEELKHGVVLDGELIAYDDAGRENFKQTVSQARSKTAVMENPCYKLFDFLTMSEFHSESESAKFGVRLETLRSFEESKHVQILEQTRYTPRAFAAMQERAVREGWEGVMLRMNAVYESKRTNNLMKWKITRDAEYCVEDITVEDMKFPNERGGEDTLRALKNAVILHKGCHVYVGSGFTKEERLEFAKHQDKIRGHIITVTYQEEFYDKKKNTWSLRCPIFKAIVGKRAREV